MLCCPYCSILSTILFSTVIPDCGLHSGSTTFSVFKTCKHISKNEFISANTNLLTQTKVLTGLCLCIVSIRVGVIHGSLCSVIAIAYVLNKISTSVLNVGTGQAVYH